MKLRTIFCSCVIVASLGCNAQTFENKYTRSLSDIMNDVAKRFNVRFKYDMDTTGLKITYADFRVRPYSIEETLTNILAQLDFKPVYQNGNLWKIKKYEYPRRVAADGKKLIDYLTTLCNNKEEWEVRRTLLRKEVRERMEIEPLLKACSNEAPQLTKVRKYDGYYVQNFCLKTCNNHTVKGSVYAPLKKGKHPLIICPMGHFAGRSDKSLQLRFATLARMGAICVNFDLWGWGESAEETVGDAHHTTEAHRMQAVNGLKILDWMMTRKDVDTTRVGVNGGSGGGTSTVLLSVLDDRFKVACPVISMSAWFDGGCPCESGMPIQLSGGGTCNPELAATFAPKPMMIISDGGDWTSTTPEVEFPFIQGIYGWYDAKDKVQNIHLPNERHDFGPNKRNGVYKFFTDVFGLDASKIDESKVTIEKEEQLRFNPKKK